MILESFDPQKIGRYTVFRAHYEYRDQPPGEKLFVALKHGTYGFDAFCWCIKATSQVQRFDLSAEARSQYVHYAAGELSFFPEDTIIDPSNFITMRHDTLASAAKAGKYHIEGEMPTDFHGKIASAIRASKLLEPKKKLALLESIGEPLVPMKSS